MYVPIHRDANPRSRWIPRTDLEIGTCTNTLQQDTVERLKYALESSNDPNVHLRDIIVWNKSNEGCNASDETAYGMLIWTEEGCWENVHLDYMYVIFAFFSLWLHSYTEPCCYHFLIFVYT